MASTQSQQCDICFQPYSPFYTIRILPVTPVISLSGTATPIHARIPGARKIICHHCHQSYSNIEPWTEPEMPPLATSCHSTEREIVEEFPASTGSAECNDDQHAHTGQDRITAPPVISPMSAPYLPNAITQWERPERDHYVPVSFSHLMPLFRPPQSYQCSPPPFWDTHCSVTIVTIATIVSFFSPRSFQFAARAGPMYAYQVRCSLKPHTAKRPHHTISNEEET